MSGTVKKEKSFRDSKQDPGFLVAKGRFVSPVEQHRDQIFRQRDDLLRDGHAGDSPDVIELTRQIDTMDKQIDADRRQKERDHVKNLASAVFMAMSRHGYANIRAVGRNANYNAVKSIAIASGYCKDKGIDLCFDICFDEGNLGALRNKHHVTSVTAMMYSLKGYKEWAEDEEETLE